MAQLARLLMENIRREVPVLPVPVLAAVFKAHAAEWLTASEIEMKAIGLLEEIERNGVKIYRPGRNRMPHYVAGALSLMQMRHFISEKDGSYRMNTDVADVIDYYANSVWDDPPEHVRQTAEKSARRQTDNAP